MLGNQASGSATLRATNEGGLILSGFTVHIENVSLGIALVKTFNLKYEGAEEVLQGDTDILLPPAGSELGAAFGLRNGDFDYARGEFTFPPGSLVVTTDVLLRKIRFAVEKAKQLRQTDEDLRRGDARHRPRGGRDGADQRRWKHQLFVPAVELRHPWDLCTSTAPARWRASRSPT